MRMTANVADLDVMGKGRIECRPISAFERETTSVCYVPTEVQDERIAYIVVQIEPEQSEALILGFVSTSIVKNCPYIVSVQYLIYPCISTI